MGSHIWWKGEEGKVQNLCRLKWVEHFLDCFRWSTHHQARRQLSNQQQQQVVFDKMTTSVYRHPQLVSKSTTSKGNSMFFDSSTVNDDVNNDQHLEKGTLLMREPLFAFGLREEYADAACHRCLKALNSCFGFSSSREKLGCDRCKRVWYCSEECLALNRSIHNNRGNSSSDNECHYLRLLHREAELVFRELEGAIDRQRLDDHSIASKIDHRFITQVLLTYQWHRERHEVGSLHVLSNREHSRWQRRRSTQKNRA